MPAFATHCWHHIFRIIDSAERNGGKIVVEIPPYILLPVYRNTRICI